MEMYDMSRLMYAIVSPAIKAANTTNPKHSPAYSQNSGPQPAAAESSTPRFQFGGHVWGAAEEADGELTWNLHLPSFFRSIEK